ncbi:MAG: IS1182 family transposase [Mogibacterium sp.]|jgi:transposase|nr:IS1182 family transposase [Mogibacterium sp.]
MLGDYQQTRLSEYARIYDILIPRDHIFRRMNEEIDFSFVRKELQDKYSVGMGRSAEDPVRMFKYLMLKAMHPASDEDLVKRAYTDMSYKFFLGLNPEDDVIDPSLLSKFRRQRLQDVDLLSLLISKSVAMAIAKGIIKRKSDIIVDATHELAKSIAYNPIDYLRKMVGQILKACEPFWGENFHKEDLPACGKDSDIEVMKEYCQALIDSLEGNGIAQVPAVANKVSLLKEGLEDMEHLSHISKDKGAKFGSKGPGKSFFGYKAHIGMTPESIVVAASVTSGEASDGDYLVPLVEQAIQNGLEVESAIADAAYAGKDNLDALRDKVKVVAPVNPIITQGHRNGIDSGFHYNKDADTYMCPAGELAYYKYYSKERPRTYDANGKTKRSYKNAQVSYFFDVKKCQECPLREGCYKGGNYKTYTVTILSDAHKEQIEFEKTPEFKQKMKKRKRIEPLNAHLKNDLGMKQNISYGIESMTMQTAVAIYMSNIQKIMKYKG